MKRTRVMPCLLMDNGALVKTVQFKNPTYVGDPLNAIKIFNDLEVDELILLDISASRCGKEPEYSLIEEIASRCFMPLTYGGGVRDIGMFRRIYNCGVEKIAVNTRLLTEPALLREASELFGSQSVLASVDVKKDLFGRYKVIAPHGHDKTRVPALVPEDYVRQLVELGAGEVLLTAVDRDGMMSGYDIDLIARVCGAVHVPVIACGGAGTFADLKEALTRGHAAAVAAGSLFVFQSKMRSVLIHYLAPEELEDIERGA